MRWHLMQEIWERGSKAVIDDAIAEALDGADALYLSVDIDVLDPGFAPGTGTPEPGRDEPGGPVARGAPDHARRQRRRARRRRGLASVRLGRDDHQQRAPRRVRIPRRTCGEASSRCSVTGEVVRGRSEGGAMRFRLGAVGLAVTVAGLGLVACGDDSASSSEPETLSVTGERAVRGQVRVRPPRRGEGRHRDAHTEERRGGAPRARARPSRGGHDCTAVRRRRAEPPRAPRSPSTWSALPAGSGGVAPERQRHVDDQPRRRARTSTSARSATRRTSRTGCSASSRSQTSHPRPRCPTTRPRSTRPSTSSTSNGLKAGENTFTVRQQG